MIGTLIGPEIKELIQARNFAALREVLVDFSPADVADIITDLREEDQAVVYRLLPHDAATDVFEYLDPSAQETVIRSMGHVEAARILDDMSADDRTALLEELPGTLVAQLLQSLSPEQRAIAQSLLNYPEGSVGRLMTPDFVRVREAWTIQQVLDYIREHGRDSETLNVIYVTDEKGYLIDDIRIREVLLRPTNTLVRDIHDADFVALTATEKAADALESFKKYDRNTLPVVDSEGRLLGIVTVDDMFDVQEEQTTEDMQKIGAVQALEEPYIDTHIVELLRKRAPWLVILFLGQMLTATVIGHFEAPLQEAFFLAAFIPLIISSGGNSGSQASTLVIRAMALGEITLTDWWKVLRKEVLSGIALGGLLGVLGLVRVLVVQNISPGTYGPHAAMIGVTVMVTIILVVLWGTLCGSMLPMILRRLGMDPATSSAPFVSTLVDVTGLLIYFVAALTILEGTVFHNK